MPGGHDSRRQAGVISNLVESEWQRVVNSPIWKSIFRTTYPDSPQQRALIVFTNVFLHLHPVRVSRRGIRVTYTFCLGGLSFFLFLVLTLTGVLLMFYYVPSVERAYTDMKDLASSVAFGMLLRNMHRWGAHGMVITVFLHMIRVFYTGAYKAPREFNWVVGVVLLILTLLLSFTGYLLPWDQLALWAITVGTNMVGAEIVSGQEMRFLLLGGFEVGQNSLLRFYVLHVIGLPLILAVFLSVHFWRIRKDGGISGPPL
ncbi:MAG: cytochrome b N-terminal domain-containing protein [Chloroflexi bacterium]|nr:cytochrome b N-terminal domain-containing protein [Chloroflexota bacterium]